MADIVKSVEHFDISTASTSTTYTLTLAQVPGNCVPFFSVKEDSIYFRSSTFDCYFSGSDLTFERDTADDTAYIEGWVVEFEPTEVLVESGAFSCDSGNSGLDSVSTTKNFNPERTGMVHWWKNSSDSYPARALTEGRVVSSGTLNFYLSDTTLGTSGHWFIFEALNDKFVVEHFSYSSTVSPYDYVLSKAYDPFNTFLIASQAGGYTASGHYIDRSFKSVTLLDRQIVSMYKHNATNTSYNSCQVIEFQDGKLHVPYSDEVIATDLTHDFNWSTYHPTPTTSGWSTVIRPMPYFDIASSTSQSTGFRQAKSKLSLDSTYQVGYETNYDYNDNRVSFAVVDWKGVSHSIGTNPSPYDSDRTFVKSVQNERIVTSGRRGCTFLDKGQDLDNCVVFFTGATDTTNLYIRNYNFNAYLLDNINALALYRYGTESSGIVDVSVVEFYPDQVRVQSGSEAGNFSTEQTINLDYDIDSTRTFLIGKSASSTDYTGYGYYNTRFSVVSSGTLGIYCNGDSSGRQQTTWYVAEDITSDNSCFAVRHYSDTCDNLLMVDVTGTETFPFYNTFLLFSVSGGYFGANYCQRSTMNIYYSSPSCPVQIGVFSTSNTKYYYAQMVRFTRDSRLYCFHYNPYFEAAQYTETITLPEQWAGKTSITVFNPTEQSYSKQNSTSQNYNSAVGTSMQITDYDVPEVTVDTYYSPIIKESSLEAICWEGSDTPSYGFSTPTRSLFKSLQTTTISGASFHDIVELTKGQDAAQCVPFATWKIYYTVAYLPLVKRCFYMEGSTDGPNYLHMVKGVYGSYEDDTTTISVVEFDPDQVRVQQGTAGFTGTDTTVDIDTVDLERAFLLFYVSVDETNTGWDTVNVSGSFQDDSTLVFEKTSSAGFRTYISWYVVECLQDQWHVQHLFRDENVLLASAELELDYRYRMDKALVFASFGNGYSSYQYTSRGSCYVEYLIGNKIALTKNVSYYGINDPSVEIVTFRDDIDIRTMVHDIETTSSPGWLSNIFTDTTPFTEQNAFVYNPMNSNASYGNQSSQTYASSETHALRTLRFSTISGTHPDFLLQKDSEVMLAKFSSVAVKLPEYNAYYMEGYTTEEDEPVSREVYCYRSDTGQLMDSTTSASGTGYFWVETTHSGSHYVVCLDDDAGVNYNHLIYGKIYPTVISGSFAYNEGLVTASGLDVGVPLGLQ